MYRGVAAAALAWASVVPGATAACPSTTTVAEETWQAALNLAVEGGKAGLGGEAGVSWSDWSRTWLPLGRQVIQDLEGNLQECPEGSVFALMNSLPAVDAEDGEASALELVKMMHHTFSAKVPPSDSLVPSQWQGHWLTAISSLLRFAYLKWVNIRHDNDLPAEINTGALKLPAQQQLLPHHAFLFRQSVDQFLASGVYDLEMTENSVLFSEAFAFSSFCNLHQVDLILESGIYKGVSTEIWSLFAKDVEAVDIFIPPEAESRLQQRSNVHVHTGDGRRLLPELLSQRKGRKAAIFIDGPKGELAIHLALSLRKLPGVAFVAMHDMEPYRSELTRLGAFFFSDEAWFQEAYGHLDEPFRKRPDLEAGGTMAFLSGSNT